MHVALVGAGLEENLALEYLVPPLRAAGHRVDAIHFDTPADRARVVATLLADPPDVIGMSVAFQHRLVEFRDLARALRSAGLQAAMVWGGHIPTARAGQVLAAYPEVDVVVRHDGETTLAELVEALAANPLAQAVATDAPREVTPPLLPRLVGIPGLAFRLPGGRPGVTPARAAVRDLDSLATPARDQPYPRQAGLRFAPILGSRGCWGRCTYCSIQTYHRGRPGPRVRLRDPDAVAAEMAGLYHHDGVRLFCFHDENFLLRRPARSIERLRAMRAGLEARGVGRIGIIAKCRPDELDADVLHEARRLGLVRAYVGIENGSQPGLDHLGRATTVESCRRALALLRDAGLYSCFNVLLFEPETTLADIDDNLAFLAGALDFPWNFCRTEVYPGSFLERSLRAAGRLRGGLEGMTYTITDPRVELLFRITAVAFGGRNFGAQSVANAASGMGYLAAVLTHFHDGRRSRSLAAQSQALVEQLGADSLERLRQARDFVAAGAQSPATVTDFARDLALGVALADARFWPAVESLRAEMNRHGAECAAERVRSRAGSTFARAAAMVVAAGLSAQGCDSGEKTTLMDPVPSDLLDATEIVVLDPVPQDVFETGKDGVWYEDSVPVDITFDTHDPNVLPEAVDPAPWDSYETHPTELPEVMDPLPPDGWGQDPAPEFIADPPPQDIFPEFIVDPVPPDLSEEANGEVTEPPPDIPIMDPPPPDMGAALAPSVPPAMLLALDRTFRLQLDAREGDGECRLSARVIGGVATARLRWEAFGGTINARGLEATFRADGSASPLIVAVADGGEGLLDVARHVPDPARRG